MPSSLRRRVHPRGPNPDPSLEKWITHEGLLVASVILGLAMLAWLEHVIVRLVRG